MLSQLNQIVNKTDNQYLSPPQQKYLLDYAKSLPARFKAARAIQEQEDSLAAKAVLEWEQSHPELGPTSDMGWPEAVDDVRVLLRTAALALLMDDPDYTQAKAAASLRQMLGFLDVPVGAVNDLFQTLAELCRDSLPPVASEALLPFLTKLTARDAAAMA